MSIENWRKFTRQEIEQFVQESYSFASLAEKIGYNKNTGHYVESMRDMIKELELDISHFTGQGWNKNNFDYDRFRKGVAIRSSDAIQALIYLRGHQCEGCKSKEWNKQLIPLELHHIDGDSLNNEMDNLQLLCPNCHALTENYCGRNINKGVVKVSDDDFAEALKGSPNIRQALRKLGLSAKGGNYTRAREIIFKYNITHLIVEDKVKM